MNLCWQSNVSAFYGEYSGSVVKNLLAMEETQIQSLDRQNPLEKEMTTLPSILAWEIPWTEKSCGLQSMGSHS